MTRACVMLPNGNSHRSVGVGMFCGILPSMGQTVLGDLKQSRAAGGAGGPDAGAGPLVEAPSPASAMRRPIPPRFASNSALGCDLDVLASRRQGLCQTFATIALDRPEPRSKEFCWLTPTVKLSTRYRVE